MCGLFAIASGDAEGVPLSDDGRVARALNRLRRRGPDGEGVWRSSRGEALLGHTRLVIVDLSDAGAQPMRDADRGLVLSYNGEIYNAPELRDELVRAGERFDSVCDTEVLLRGIGAWGVRSALERVRGMFAFVLWDEREKQLHAAVDHAGIKPLVWCARGGRIALASDLDALRSADGGSFEMDGDALADVLCRGHVAAPRTVWRGVSRLRPGTLLRWDAARGARVETWWRAPSRETGPVVEAEECASMIERSVGARLVSDVPVGLLLSSGLDSGVIGWACARAGREDVRAFSLAMGEGHDESAAAGDHARALGLAHERIALDSGGYAHLLQEVGGAFDEPQAYGGLLAMVAVSRAVRAQTKVVLSGDGGDELLGGYGWHREMPEVDGSSNGSDLLADVWDARPGERWRALDALRGSGFAAGYQQAVFPRFHPVEARALLSGMGSTYGVDAYASVCARSDAEGLAWPRRAQRIDLDQFCSGSVLAKVDRASMWYGLEVRVPLLDRDVLERCLGARVRWSGEGKDVLREILRPALPAGATERPKQGFSLRVMGEDDWARERERLRTCALVRDGVIDGRWERLVGEGAPYRDGRTLAISLMDAWYRERS